jgi:ATP-binding cassette subfamily F protein 3
MFSGEDVDKKVKVLSGGERMRLAMIKLMLEPVNFLVLDEPTNHLDIRSKEMLKNALAGYDGTVLVVSHDREFLDGLVKCVYEFKQKKIRQHLGGIYDFLQKKKLESLKELEQKSKPAVAAEVKKEAVPVVEANKLSYEERKEINKQISRLEKSIEQTENDIARLEDEVAAMDEKMANPANLGDPSIFESYDQLKQNLEQVMDQWSDYTGEYEELLKQKNW